MLEAVSAAVRDRQTLRFDYAEARDSPRRTQPHAIVARNGRWYLIAWDIDRDDWRIFRLDRMTPRIPTGPDFRSRTIPAPDARSYLAARFTGSHGEDRWPCVGEIVIDLPAKEVAPWIGDGELHELTARSCRITVESWSWVGVLAFVTRFDASFTIVGPDALVAASRMLAKRVSAST